MYDCNTAAQGQHTGAASRSLGGEKPWLPRRCRGGVLMEDQSEPWDELWARLSKQGWRHERHPRPRDHLFLPPGVDRTDPNAVLRRHYFDSQTSVRSFVSLSDATAVKDEPSDTPVRARPQAARPTAMLRPPCSEGKSGAHSAALVASAARSAAFRKRPRRLGQADEETEAPKRQRATAGTTSPASCHLGSEPAAAASPRGDQRRYQRGAVIAMRAGEGSNDPFWLALVTATCSAVDGTIPISWLERDARYEGRHVFWLGKKGSLGAEFAACQVRRRWAPQTHVGWGADSAFICTPDEVQLVQKSLAAQEQDSNGEQGGLAS